MISKPRILFILHFPPPIHGSSVVGQIIKKSSIINNQFTSTFINLGTSVTIDEIGKKPFRKIGRYVLIIIRVLFHLLKNNHDLCYFAISAKGPAFYKDSLIALLIKIFGKKLVFHFHNKGVRNRQQLFFDNILYKLVFKNAHAILLSKFLYSDIEKYFSTNRVYICPNGISDEKQNIKVLPKENNPVKILFLSNLLISKGVFLLLEACQILKQKKLSFHCTCIGGEGDITAHQFQKKASELKIEEHVVYLGKKYGNEKAENFLNADIFVHPTYEDCFPLVLLEAMQFALPIVSTYEGGIPDIIEKDKTGFLVPLKDVEALADKLERLIRNSELRKKMGEAGRKRYEQKFTLKKFEEKFSWILNDIINE